MPVENPVSHGLTYQEIADRAGFTCPGAWKHCRMFPLPADAALRYHRALGIPLADMLSPELMPPELLPREPKTERRK